MALKLKNPTPKVAATPKSAQATQTSPNLAQVMRNALAQQAAQTPKSPPPTNTTLNVTTGGGRRIDWGKVLSYDIGEGIKKYSGYNWIKNKASSAKGGIGSAAGKYTPTLKEAFVGTRRSGGSFWWVFFSIMLYFTDVVITSFNGFDIVLFANVFTNIGVESLIRIFVNAAVIAGLVAYALILKPDKREFISSFVLIELVWIIISFGGVNGSRNGVGSILHLIYAITFLIAVVHPSMEDRTRANFLISICIFVDFFLFSLIAKLAPNLPYFNRLIIPIWFFLALAFTRPGKIKGWVTFFVIMFYTFNAFAVVNEYNTFKVGAETLGGKERTAALEYATTSGKNVWKFFTSSVPFLFKQKVNATLGPYYTGDIDKNAQERLGVYIEELKAADVKFYEDQPVTIWATIIAKTIEEGVNVSMDCKEKINDRFVDVADVTVSPKQFDIEEYEETDVECVFRAGSLTQGWRTVAMNADFNFLTMAYIKTYFMSKETERALRRENVDPLDNYGITDKEPRAIYTSGPVMIGLDVGKPPLNTEDSFRFGIVLTDMWEGKIKQVTDLYIVTPKEIVMDNKQNDSRQGESYYCGGKRNYLFKKDDCKSIGEDKKGCDNQLHNVYKISLTNDTIKDIDTTETILCRFKVDDAKSLMNEAPIATKYFKVVTKYNYSLYKEIGVEIKGGDGIKTFLNNCTQICLDKDNCICPNGCVTAKDTEVGKDVNCGGNLADGKRENLLNCSEKCSDLDGCICPDGCNKPINTQIAKNDDCGGLRTTGTGSVAGTYTQAPSELSIKINNGDATTSVMGVNLYLHAKDAQECTYVNDNDPIPTDPARWVQVTSEDWQSGLYSLLDVAGERLVVLVCRNNIGQSQATDTIIYQPGGSS